MKREAINLEPSIEQNSVDVESNATIGSTNNMLRALCWQNLVSTSRRTSPSPTSTESDGLDYARESERAPSVAEHTSIKKGKYCVTTRCCKQAKRRVGRGPSTRADFNVIDLSHSLCSLIGRRKFGRRKPKNIPQTQT
ncbi:unnamed protein product [Boreogadus saida]